jgi:hypothetical protein
MKISSLRVSLAFLLAPIVPCTLYVVTLSAMSGQWSGIVSFLFPMIAVCLALNLSICLPAYLLLQRFWKVRLIECLVAGIFTAIALNLIIYLMTVSMFTDGSNYSASDSGGATYINNKITTHGVYTAILGILYQAGLGASIGFCFWVIALWRNPKKL